MWCDTRGSCIGQMMGLSGEKMDCLGKGGIGQATGC